jgi:hypothetical protein
MSVKIEFIPNDLWVGIYWKRTNAILDSGPSAAATDVYVCIIPCFPIHITVWHRLSIPFGDKP